jgi:perosamine synthetase
MQVDKIIQTIKKLTDKDFNPLHAPVFSGNEEKYLVDCVRSNFVSSVGEYVDRFEGMLAEFTGAASAVVAVNGTAALQVALRLVGVEPNDEVLIPALSFVATANAVSYIGAVPHFVDVEEKTLGIDPEALDEYLSHTVTIKDGQACNARTGRRIKAVVPMHTFGHPVDMDPLLESAKRYKIEVVEDAAESLGSYYKGVHTGNFGRIAALSFNGNKIITTGGGGAIITNDETLAKTAKHMTTTAKVPHRWEYMHDMVGYNFRMPALNAALGCAQLEQLPGFIEKKRRLAGYYEEAFAGLEGVRFFTEPEYAKSNYWLNVLLLDTPDLSLRDEILRKTNESGIMTRPVWRLLSTLDMYKECPSMELPVSRHLERRIINIPSSADLMDNLTEKNEKS